jgi:tetratricopeptide (TPR) repeat protein
LTYSTGEVARILDLTPQQVRACVRAGILSPGRGPGGELRFCFEDLASLRNARPLLAARLPARRVRGAIEKLRGQLPPGRRLSAVRLGVEGDRIVAREGEDLWQPESGQTLFDFGAEEGVGGAAAALAEIPAESSGEAMSADEWYRRGCELEPESPEEARDAYRRALVLDPGLAEAHVNLGRLLHESGDAAAASEHYRRALAARPDDVTAAFNLGVALEDLARPSEALAAYEDALSLDPGNADAHYNAANLCERLGRPADALRHLKEYRALTRPRSG